MTPIQVPFIAISLIAQISSQKPKIKIWRNFRGEAKWKCVGPDCYALGETPITAYQNYLDDLNFPF